MFDVGLVAFKHRQKSYNCYGYKEYYHGNEY